MLPSTLKFLKTIWDAGGEVYEVGGSVRDRLLGIEHKDKDLLVRNIPLESLKNLLTPYGKIAMVGKAFGVLKFTPHTDPSSTFDIALPRKEISIGVGHRDFHVEYDPNLPLEEDLKRRDFTINAMAFDLKGELARKASERGRLHPALPVEGATRAPIIDPLEGQKDLEQKILRQVFEKAFEEDPLRLIRAVQFAARFSLTIESKTLEAMKKQAPLIETVSSERIIEEIKKLFLANTPSLGLEIMREVHLLDKIFPELSALIGIEQDKRPGDDVYRHTLRVLDATRNDPYLQYPGDLELMLAALFHDVGKAKTHSYDKEKDRIVFYGHQIVSKQLCRKWLQKMKATILGVHPENIENLVLNHMFETKSYFTDKAIRRFIQKIGPDLIFKLLDLRLADNRGGKHPKSIKGVLKMRERVQEVLSQKPPFGPQDLAITGHDIMALGIPQGPQVGQILKRLVELVLDDPTLNTKEQLITIVKEITKEAT